MSFTAVFRPLRRPRGYGPDTGAGGWYRSGPHVPR